MGEGTSTTALAVSIDTRLSSRRMVSPSLTYHSTMVASGRPSPRSGSRMYSGLVDLALLNGDFASAMAPAEQGMQRAEQSGSPFMRAIALRALGLALGLNDRHAEGVEALSEALQIGRAH